MYLRLPYTTMGEFSLNLIATLVITALPLTEMTYMEINSQGTSGEAKLGKNGPAARVIRRKEILIQRNVIQTEIRMKSNKIKRYIYIYIALLLFRQLARIRTNIVNPGHRAVNAKTIQSTCCSIARKVAESVQVCMMLKK